jgi:hypothetical protein
LSGAGKQGRLPVIRIEFDEYLSINENDQYECGICGESLCDTSEGWWAQTIQLEGSTEQMRVHRIKPRDDFVLRRYIRPDCKTQIDAELCLADDDPLEWDRSWNKYRLRLLSDLNVEQARE